MCYFHYHQEMLLNFQLTFVHLKMYENNYNLKEYCIIVLLIKFHGNKSKYFK